MIMIIIIIIIKITKPSWMNVSTVEPSLSHIQDGLCHLHGTNIMPPGLLGSPETCVYSMCVSMAC